jgi:hypothetical protein
MYEVLCFQVQKSFHQLMLTLAIYDFIYVAISMVLFGLPAIDERYICGAMELCTGARGSQRDVVYLG